MLMKITDIARAAMSIEDKGSHFYSALAARTDDERAKQVFLKLAEEEKEHRRVFEKMLSLYEGDEVLDEGVAGYLNAVLKGSVFPGPATLQRFLEEIKSVKDALSIGIQAEKDAILLYNELMTRTSSEKARKMLGHLLEEEKMHLIDLRNYYEEL